VGLLDERLGSPFKFIYSWLILEEFQSIFKTNRHQFKRGVNFSLSMHFVSNLKRLKGLVSTWEMERRRFVNHALWTIEDNMERIYGYVQYGHGV